MNNVNQQRIESFNEGLTITLTESGSGRPVVVLHGGAGPRSVADFVSAMSEHNRVITPTHPGFAGTSRPEWFDSIDDIAIAYLELLERMNLQEVLLIGFSVGGWIASEMALRSNGRISHIVLVNAIGIAVEGETVADVFTLTPPELIALSYHDPVKFGINPATLPQAQKEAMQANFAALAVYTRGRDKEAVKLRRRLQRVTTRTLVVWGSSDRIATANYGRAYAQAFGNGEFKLIEACGHMPQIEKGAELLGIVTEFGMR